MPITISACCCAETCCDCNLAAFAIDLCEGGTHACGDAEIITFNPLGCDNKPNPNPGRADGTSACYTYVEGNTVTVTVPQYLTCDGKLYEFRWWETGDCIADPASNGWVPFTGQPGVYGCHFDPTAVVEFCDPAGGCNVDLQAKYEEIPDAGCPGCGCDCLPCYFSGEQDGFCNPDPQQPGCESPCEFV